MDFLTKQGGGVFDLKFDLARLRMAKHVDQRLASDAVDLVPSEKIEKPAFSLNREAEVGRVSFIQLLAHEREGLY